VYSCSRFKVTCAIASAARNGQTCKTIHRQTRAGALTLCAFDLMDSSAWKPVSRPRILGSKRQPFLAISAARCWEFSVVGGSCVCCVCYVIACGFRSEETARQLRRRQREFRPLSSIAQPRSPCGSPRDSARRNCGHHSSQRFWRTEAAGFFAHFGIDFLARSALTRTSRPGCQARPTAIGQNCFDQ